MSVLLIPLFRNQYLVYFIDTFVPEYILRCKGFLWQFEELVVERDVVVFRVWYSVRWADAWLSDSDLKDVREVVETFHSSQHTEGYVII